MIRIIKILLVCTVLFHIVRTTYLVNIQEEKIQSINNVLIRIERQLPGWPSSLNRDAHDMLSTMEKTYPSAPRATEEFTNRLKN